jgi:hypothetical protein
MDISDWRRLKVAVYLEIPAIEPITLDVADLLSYLKIHAGVVKLVDALDSKSLSISS